MLLSLDRDNGDDPDGTDGVGLMDTSTSKDAINAVMDDENHEGQIADNVSEATNFGEAEVRSAFS